MKRFAGVFFLAAVLLSPSAGRAQSVGRVECEHASGYAYLYSSMTTLDVRTTLQCGEEVQVTGRYDEYFGVRTAKGEVGYVPAASLVLYKNGDKKAPAKPAALNRERTQYDARPAAPEPTTAPPSGELVLRSGTAVRLWLLKTMSSATTKVGESVDFEVAEDVLVDGVCVIAKGAAASGTVSEAEGKKRMGHGGAVGITLNSVQLANNEKLALRGYQEARGSSPGAPLMSGKDATIQKGTEFTALVDSDVHLKRESFAARKGETAQSSPQSPN